MICQWRSLIELLPCWMRRDVDYLGKECLQELRLRLNMHPELVTNKGSLFLGQVASCEDLEFCINVASRYSPWASSSMKYGYITAPGGHRIGLCGEIAEENGVIKSYQAFSSLCIRVSRDFPGIADKINTNGSVLIIGSPGTGKTTLLRDLIRQISDTSEKSVAVIDERAEIFPYVNHKPCYPIGKKTDILSGYTKKRGLDMLIRTMGPETVALDEITSAEDCDALMHAGWCGVRLIATAHAKDAIELRRRPIYKPLIDSQMFDSLIVLHKDKSWHQERMIQ